MGQILIPRPPQENPHWPLPHDYEDLTQEGQRKARVNTCSLWKGPFSSMDERMRLTSASWNFFDRWYLWPDEEGDFDPLFYDQPPLAPPEGHFLMDRVWATSPFSVIAAPRGFAKSSKIRRVILPCLLTQDGYGQIYATSSDSNASFTGNVIRNQLISNPRIISDFSKEMRTGRIVPRRGEAPFGVENIQIGNHAWLQCLSVKSRQRGRRPRVYWLDDPEYDGSQSTSLETLRTDTYVFLFKVVIPMLMQKGSMLRWAGTYISKRHLLWHAMETVIDPKGRRRSRNPVFDHWTRVFIDLIVEEEGKEPRSSWPEMWPLTEEDIGKDESLQGRMSIERMKEVMGHSVFMAEMRGRPGEGNDCFFPDLKEETHGYRFIKGGDPKEGPRTSHVTVEWENIQGETCRELMRDLLDRSWLFMTVDTSFTSRSDSDWKVCCVMGVTSENVLFVWDIWSGKTTEDVLVNKCFEMADRWKVPVIYPEVVKQSIALYHTLDSMSKQRATEMVGVSHIPRIVPLKVGMMSKTGKIGALKPRFDHGLVKLPLFLSMDPHWLHLFDQLAGFNPEALDGGLAHDDHLDALSMSGLILKGRKGRSEETEEREIVPLEEMRKGNMYHESGMPYVFMVDWTKVPPGAMQALVEQGDMNVECGTPGKSIA